MGGVTYALLAELLALLHAAFILFVVLGGLFVGRFPRLLVPHLTAAAWGVFVAASGGTCPLTPLENWALARAGREGYSGGFLEHYLSPLIYPEGLTRETQWALAALVVVANGCVYGVLARRRGSKAASNSSTS
jgi:hypothetical protein